jgi:UDP-glucose 4-epimerase
MKILVTGGAGYIGSLCVKKLIDNNHEVVVIDNLSHGRKDLIDKNAVFYEKDLNDMIALDEIFTKHKIESVIHFAGYKDVGESSKNGIKYSQNISGTINLLNAMVKHNVNKIIYSSSAALYGIPLESKPITEENPVSPINYYGYTKLCCEDLIKWYGQIYNLKYVSLRYFNVAGDGGLNYVDYNAQNVIPIIMEVVFEKRDIFQIYGNDYDTRDGTCIRDYIDVSDLVNAHILALNCNNNEIINLGTGLGTSVKELLDVTLKVTNINIPFRYVSRREGDPAFVVSGNEKAKKVLGWLPKYDIFHMINTTYNAYKHDFDIKNK